MLLQESSAKESAWVSALSSELTRRVNLYWTTCFASLLFDLLGALRWKHSSSVFSWGCRNFNVQRRYFPPASRLISGNMHVCVCMCLQWFIIFNHVHVCGYVYKGASDPVCGSQRYGPLAPGFTGTCEAPSVSSGNQYRNLQSDIMQRIGVLGPLSPRWYVSIKSLLSRHKRARGDWGY